MDIKQRLDENTSELAELVAQFPDTGFNQKPNEESWSAAEVIEHLFRTEFGTGRVLTGETKITKDRDSDAVLAKIKKVALNRDDKLTASGPILPTGGEKSKKELLGKFRQNREKVKELMTGLDLDELCLAFEHPIFGTLTRREWLEFNMMHTQRHMAQIEQIQKAIK
jgi:uncharacterized damage-inducible protein DinB